MRRTWRGRDRRFSTAGGAERTNVFTRAQLALFGQVPWRAVPVMPLEIMHLPLWFPFHLSKVSYWSRTVIVPLLVLMALRPVARNPRDVAIPELFRTPPAQVRDWIRGPYRSVWGRFFKAIDSVLRVVQPAFPRRGRSSAIEKAVRFVTERLNGDDGLGGIYPAIANSVMMFDTLGYPPEHPAAAIAWRAVRKLLVVEDDRAYCQPCLSPVWDTGLAGHAMAEAGADTNAACAWLRERQILDVVGDWSVRRRGLRPGGWAFQYANPHYPDVDDTAVVGMLLHRNGDPAYAEAIERAREWIIGMQSSDGGWGAFEPENTHLYLNNIPFADHGALLDPPTSDVTARCVSFLAQIGMPADDPVLAKRSGIPAPRTGGGGKLVRPLGHQLHLRHMVGAVRVQRCRHRAGRSGGAARAWTGWCRCSARMAVGVRTRRPTATRRMAATRRARRARRRGRCSG